MTTRYITITELCRFHEVEDVLIVEFSDAGFFSIVETSRGPCIAEAELPTIEAMLRLHTELGINAAGVETIMHMRHKMESLQQELRYLKARLGDSF